MSRNKVVIDDIEFDSQLEGNHYVILRDNPKVNIIEIHKGFYLLDGFAWVDFPTYKTRRYRNMVYTPDFIVNIVGVDKPVAIESKGFARKDYNIRKKLFIKFYGDKYYHWQVSSKKQLEDGLGDLCKD